MARFYQTDAKLGWYGQIQAAAPFDTRLVMADLSQLCNKDNYDTNGAFAYTGMIVGVPNSGIFLLKDASILQASTAPAEGAAGIDPTQYGWEKVSNSTLGEPIVLGSTTYNTIEEAVAGIGDVVESLVAASGVVSVNGKDGVVTLKSADIDLTTAIEGITATTIQDALVAINAKAASAYKAKGSDTWENIQAITNAQEGDVWDVSTEFTIDGKTYPAGTNIVWTGDAWDVLTGLVDLSGYQTKTLSSEIAGETTVEAALSAINTAATTNAGDIAALETTVGDTNSGLVKDVADLKTTVGDDSAGLVKQVSDIQGNITTINNTLATKADSDDVVKLDGGTEGQTITGNVTIDNKLVVGEGISSGSITATSLSSATEIGTPKLILNNSELTAVDTSAISTSTTTVPTSKVVSDALTTKANSDASNITKSVWKTALGFVEATDSEITDKQTKAISLSTITAKTVEGALTEIKGNATTNAGNITTISNEVNKKANDADVVKLNGGTYGQSISGPLSLTGTLSTDGITDASSVSTPKVILGTSTTSELTGVSSSLTSTSSGTTTVPSDKAVVDYVKTQIDAIPATDLSNYVDKTSAQIISGVKVFNGGIIVANRDNDVSLAIVGSSDYVQINGSSINGTATTNSSGYYGGKLMVTDPSFSSYSYPVINAETGSYMALDSAFILSSEKSDFVALSGSQYINGSKGFNNLYFGDSSSSNYATFTADYDYGYYQYGLKIDSGNQKTNIYGNLTTTDSAYDSYEYNHKFVTTNPGYSVNSSDKYALIDFKDGSVKEVYNPTYIDDQFRFLGSTYVPLSTTVNGSSLGSNVTIDAAHIPLAGSSSYDTENVSTELAKKANLEGGNTFSGTQTLTGNLVLGGYTSGVNDITTDGDSLAEGSSTDLTTAYAVKDYVTTQVSTKADDSAVVHKAGEEEITGKKTFTSEIVANTGINTTTGVVNVGGQVQRVVNVNGSATINLTANTATAHVRFTSATEIVEFDIMGSDVYKEHIAGTTDTVDITSTTLGTATPSIILSGTGKAVITEG